MKVPYMSFAITQKEFDKFIKSDEHWGAVRRKEGIPWFENVFLKGYDGIEQKITNARHDERCAPFVELLEGLFWLIESQTMDDVEPDYTLPMPSADDVNDLYQRIDNHIEKDLNNHSEYWAKRGKDMGPEYNKRLSSKAKLWGYQRWQELQKTLKTNCVWLWYKE